METPLPNKDPGKKRMFKKTVKSCKKILSTPKGNGSFYQKKLKSAINISLNKSCSWNTLKANNRALAGQVEKLKHDLSRMSDVYTSMLERNNDLAQNNISLSRQLKEVKQQIKMKIKSLKTNISFFMDTCVDLGDLTTRSSTDPLTGSARNSKGSARNSEAGHLDGSVASTVSSLSSYSDETSSRATIPEVVPPGMFHLSESDAPQGVSEMSMIMEQSMVASPAKGKEFKRSKLGFGLKTHLPMRVPKSATIEDVPDQETNNQQLSKQKCQKESYDLTSLGVEDNDIMDISPPADLLSTTELDFLCPFGNDMEEVPVITEENDETCSNATQTRPLVSEKNMVNEKPKEASLKANAKVHKDGRKALKDINSVNVNSVQPTQKQITNDFALLKAQTQIKKKNQPYNGPFESSESTMHTFDDMELTMTIDHSITTHMNPYSSIKPDTFDSNKKPQTFTNSSKGSDKDNVDDITIGTNKLSEINADDYDAVFGLKNRRQTFYDDRVVGTKIQVNKVQIDASVKSSSLYENKPSSFDKDNLQSNSHRSRDKGKDQSVANNEEEANIPEAVTMRSRKPGQLVFAAARKEDDGTRKNLPTNAPKARSKSKKQIAEMIENLPKKDAESIFDFHDQTPRPAAEKNKQPSVYDISYVSPAVHIGKNTELQAQQKTLSLLNTTVTQETLKDEVSGDGKTKDRSRSKSKSRSKASTNKDTDVPIEESKSCHNLDKAVRDKSRSRTKSRGRSLGEKLEKYDDSSYNKEMAVRAKSRGRSPVNKPEKNEQSCHGKERAVRAKSRSRAKSRERSSNGYSDKKEESSQIKSRPKSTGKSPDTREETSLLTEIKRSQRAKSRGRSQTRSKPISEPGFESTGKSSDTQEETSPFTEIKQSQRAKSRGRSQTRSKTISEPGLESASGQSKFSPEKDIPQSPQSSKQRPRAKSRGRSRGRAAAVQDLDEKETSKGSTEVPSAPKIKQRTRSRTRSQSRAPSDHDSDANPEDIQDSLEQHKVPIIISGKAGTEIPEDQRKHRYLTLGEGECTSMPLKSCSPSRPKQREDFENEKDSPSDSDSTKVKTAPSMVTVRSRGRSRSKSGRVKSCLKVTKPVEIANVDDDGPRKDQGNPVSQMYSNDNKMADRVEDATNSNSRGLTSKEFDTMSEKTDDSLENETSTKSQSRSIKKSVRSKSVQRPSKQIKEKDKEELEKDSQELEKDFNAKTDIRTDGFSAHSNNVKQSTENRRVINKPQRYVSPSPEKKTNVSKSRRRSHVKLMDDKSSEQSDCKNYQMNPIQKLADNHVATPPKSSSLKHNLSKGLKEDFISVSPSTIKNIKGEIRNKKISSLKNACNFSSGEDDVNEFKNKDSPKPKVIACKSMKSGEQTEIVVCSDKVIPETKSNEIAARLSSPKHNENLTYNKKSKRTNDDTSSPSSVKSFVEKPLEETRQKRVRSQKVDYTFSSEDDDDSKTLKNKESPKSKAVVSKSKKGSESTKKKKPKVGCETTVQKDKEKNETKQEEETVIRTARESDNTISPSSVNCVVEKPMEETRQKRVRSLKVDYTFSSEDDYDSKTLKNKESPKSKAVVSKSKKGSESTKKKKPKVSCESNVQKNKEKNETNQEDETVYREARESETKSSKSKSLEITETIKTQDPCHLERENRKLSLQDDAANAELLLERLKKTNKTPCLSSSEVSSSCDFERVIPSPGLLKRPSSQLSCDPSASDPLPEVKRRRGATKVNYSEPSLNSKLRRGDPHTNQLNKTDKIDIFKSKSSNAKKKAELRKDILGPLHNLVEKI